MRRGLSVRWRLTLVYTAITVTTATVLLAGIYVLVSQVEGPGLVVRSELRGDEVSLEPGGDTVPDSGDIVARRALIDAQEFGVAATLDNLLLWSLIGVLLTAAVSLAVGWSFAGRALAPVHTITSRARSISADSLDERVSLGGPHDELREMADTFDALLDRLQSAFESERRLVATMSHELRTPLANQRTALDVALADPEATAADLRAAAAVALDQTHRANETVEALLTLARVQSGVEPARRDPVDLAAVVDAAVAEARSGAGAGLEWQVDLGPAVVPGDAELLRRAVVNLVDNAVVHNVADGRVRVRLEAAAGTARLTVANTGPLVAPDVAGDLVLPFRRGTVDRTASDRGVGLGLSIVQAVADHHDGHLALTPLAGGGLDVGLALPALG